MKVIVLTPEIADMLWSDFKGHMELAIATHPGERPESLDDVRRDVRAGNCLVLEVFDALELLAVAVVEFADLKDGKCLHVRYLGGERLDEWVDELHQRLGEVARAYDCKWIGLTGRMGWKKALKRLGYNPIAIQLRAEVD